MTGIADYDFQLPGNLIAQHPLENRVDARLMVVNRQDASISHHYVRDLPDLLRDGDCLVINNSRVIPARLVGFRTLTRGRWQGLVLSTKDDGPWQIMSNTRGRIQPGETVTLEDREGRPGIELRLLAKLQGGTWAARPETKDHGDLVLAQYGRVPLPPYIRGGEMVDRDIEDYQTVYASSDGSVAAPTAGLHFTGDLLASIRDRGTTITELTLHVGLGTFRPVSCDRLEDHQMHSEWGVVGSEAVQAIRGTRSNGGRVIAVGTTSARLLETASRDGELTCWDGETDIFIFPPFEFQSTDALMTNFHLPRSTLLVMVRAFGGDELIRRAYVEAINEEYRFYSYGDTMLIL